MRKAIEVEFQINTEEDKSILSVISKNEELKVNTHCVYVYSLADDDILYPIEKGKVIYIGEAWRQNEPTGKRFTGHITKTSNEGNNFTTNRAISSYYYSGFKLKLEVYCLDNVNTEQARKEQEKKLYTLHAKKYGALPIGQGSTGENYTPENLKTIIGSNVENSAITP